MNRKNWIRLLCTALAVLLFAAGSGVSFAMAEQPEAKKRQLPKNKLLHPKRPNLQG